MKKRDLPDVEAIRREVEAILGEADPNDPVQVWTLLASFEPALKTAVQLASSGDQGALRGLRMLIKEADRDGRMDEINSDLYWFMVDFTADNLGPSKRGRGRSNLGRDFYIYLAVFLCTRRGLSPTRTSYKRKGEVTSASQVVHGILAARGIEISAPRIEDICKRFPR